LHIVDRALAIAPPVQIEGETLDLGIVLKPLVQRLEIDRAQVGVTLVAKAPDQMAADKAARAGDEDLLVVRQWHGTGSR
jgi:hypothetical protein